jgi:hypothetical protein
MPLDTYLPHYDVREYHSLTIGAPPERVIAASRELRGSDSPLFVLLMGLRSLPSLLRGRRISPSRPLVGEFERAGFFALEERPDELVLGVVGRFWRLDGGVREIDPADFEAFAEPGWAKAAFNFHARSAGAGATLLTTETRVLCTDPASRRNFKRYWRLVHPGSAAIRIAWLRAIRRRATR